MRLLKGYRGLALGLLVAGTGAVVVGALHPSHAWALWLTSVGGAVVGASIASLFARLSAEELFVFIRRVLKDTLGARLLSDEEAVRPYRRRWYQYCVSQKAGRMAWKCLVLDFSKSSGVGRLTTRLSTEGTDGQRFTYDVEAAVRNERFLIFAAPERGREPVALDVLPLMGLDFMGKHAGLSFVQTWDGNHAIVPILMADRPLHSISTQGEVPEELWPAFDEEWRRAAGAIRPLIPFAGRPEGIAAPNAP